MNFNTIKGFVCAAIAALALSGCGGTPGDAEVREALRNKTITVGEQLNGKKATAADLKEIDAELQKVKVVACRKAEPENGFNCDWTGGDKFAMVTGGSRRILKGDSGWILAEGR